MSDEDVKSDILSIFPTPVYLSQLEILNENELNFVKENEKKVNLNNDGKNYISDDTFVLDNLELKNLRQKINLRIEDYFKKIICTNDLIEPYITQSWLNFNYKNTSHEQHIHRNSIISGVYYVQCHDDNITFLRPRKETFEFGDIFNYNHFNSNSLSLRVKQGLLIIFPSNLIHKVDLNDTDRTRISLPFNVFVSGTVGKKNELQQLTFRGKEKNVR
tara:strand:- start:893 stop:1543 length:651 start_codon:yes stop_codon:yes gene_type:complete